MFKNKKIKIGVLVLYCIVALMATWPLVLNLNSAISGNEGDNFSFLWNHWHVKNSLDHLNNPFYTNLIAYPFFSSLAIHSLTLVPSLVSALLQYFLPLVFSFNIVFLATIVATAFAMYLLADYIFDNKLVSFFCGLFFAFNPHLVQSFLGQYNYVSLFCLPLYLLFLLKTLRFQSVMYGTLAGIVVVICIYTDSYYTVGLILVSILVLCWYFFKDFTLIKKTFQSILALTIVAVLGSIPYLLSVKSALKEKIYSPQIEDVSLYSPDIRSFLIPSKDSTFFGSRLTEYYQQLNFHGSIIYITFTLLFLVIISLFLYKRKNISYYSQSFWLIFSLVFLFITLGPTLFFGKSFIRLPFVWLRSLPIINNILVTPHFISFFILGLTMLCGAGLKKIFEKISSPILLSSLSLLIGGVYLLETLIIPLPLTLTQIPNFYYDIAKDSEDYTLLELPFNLSSSFYTLGGNGRSPSKTQYYQTVHKKKILSAWISRLPEKYYPFYNSIIGLNYLITPNQFLPVKVVESVSSQTQKNFKTLGIRYIIIHPEYYNHVELTNTIQFLNTIYKQQPILRDGMLIYKI